MTYPHFPKPAKGAKVVGYAPLTGQPKHEDGTLKIALQYEPKAAKVIGIDLASYDSIGTAVVRQQDGSFTVEAATPAKRRPRSVLDLERDPAYRANPGDQAGPDQGQLV